ncbi:MAG TPA: isoprenylcysteine carboxylmethyltransferase family protein [Alphaproteobacteria bacterium]|nr:isoprenylcysteine carboxylmethyltransferase family protein [Alphaproteobacteria bacterium]
MNLSDSIIRIGDWFFKYRNVAFPVMLVALFTTLPPRPFMGSPVIDAWTDMLGLLLALAGSALRAWVIGLAYIKRGGLDKKVHADTLVSSGMFAVCRNPLYVGNALVLLGLFVVHNNALAWLVGLVFFGVAYWGIVAAEEKFLQEKFGDDYRAYCARVNRFWPDFGQYREAVAGMDFNWRRVVIKDYSTVYTWVAGMIILIAWEHAYWGGGSFLDAISSVLIPLGIATAIVLLIRVLKKRGLLPERTA